MQTSYDRKMLAVTSVSFAIYHLLAVLVYYSAVFPIPVNRLAEFVMIRGSPLLVPSFLIAIPLLAWRGGKRTLQIALVMIAVYLITDFEGVLGILLHPVAYFQRADVGLATCHFLGNQFGRYQCLDHALFHILQLPFYAAMIYFGYRAYRFTKEQKP